MPPTVPLPPSRRVVVRFRRDVDLPYDASAVEQLANQAGHDWNEITGPHPGTRFGLLYPTIPVDRLKGYSLLTPAFGTKPFHFTSDFVVDCPPNVSPAAVAERINAWDSVGVAYVQAGAAPPPSSVMSANDPLSHSQHYLGAAPDGVDARWVWDNTPANGAGVRLVDLEQGWFLDHEDLLDAAIPVPIRGENLVFRDHGSSVLGIVRATDNLVGIVGVAPQCRVQVVSPWTCQFAPCVDHSAAGLEYHLYNVAEAIHAAILSLNPGDVLLLESQYGTPDGYGGALPPWLPAEVDDVVYDAIRLAVTNKIVVVEAAANGTVDLDTYARGTDRILDPTPTNDKFRQSGAILVGAAVTAAVTAAEPLRSRLASSNFGKRVDCYAWGRGVRSTGEISGPIDVKYPANFGETSAAAAIVAGAAVLLQSWRDAVGAPRYTPARLRELFRDPALNTASHSAADKIGVMPNLRAIVEAERAALPVFQRMPQRVKEDAMRLLFERDPATGHPPLGALRDFLERIDPSERDAVLGMLALDLSERAQRKSIAKRLRKAARRILKDARKKPKHGR